MRRVFPALGMVFFLLAGGCGLSDYEKQMETERKRLDEYDNQTKYLGDPIKFRESVKEEDSKKDKTPPTARAFIRPPKEIVTKSPRMEGSVLRAYDVAGSAAMNATFQSFYLGVGLTQKQADFRSAVLAPFRIPGSTNMKDVSVQPTGRPAMRFQTLQGQANSPMGESNLYIYFYEEAPYNEPAYQVAIIYKVLKSKAGSDVDEAIRYSLGSLRVGGAAIRAESRQ